MKQRNKVLFSAILGNILEYYDFTVYVIFSVVIGKTFFPEADSYTQDLLSLTIFASGFIARPVGGILFGYIGDKYGRRVALICSMLGMTIPTFSIGLIPDFQAIGHFAPIFLIIMRMLQGLCISGEGAGAAIFVLEHLHNFRPGFITGLVQSSNILGTIIATIIGITIEHYFAENIGFAWRYAFIIGGMFGIVGFFLRLWVSETPIFALILSRKSSIKQPFLTVIKSSYHLVFITMCVGAAASSIVYMIKSYINLFYLRILHVDNLLSLTYLFYSSLILMIMMPISGMLSDKFGKLFIIRISSFLIVTFSIPTLMFMSSELLIVQLFGLSMLSIMGGLISGAAYIFVISLFIPEQRYTGVGFAYNLGIACFGGTSAIISRMLVGSTGLYYSPAFYLIFTSSLLLFCISYYTKKGFIKGP